MKNNLFLPIVIMIISFFTSIHFNLYNSFLISKEIFMMILFLLWIIANLEEVKIVSLRKNICDMFYDGEIFNFLSENKLFKLNDDLKYAIYIFLEREDILFIIQKIYLFCLLVIVKFFIESNLTISKNIFYTFLTLTTGLFFINLFDIIKNIYEYKKIKILKEFVTKKMNN
jgi:hypothetical protein